MCFSVVIGGGGFACAKPRWEFPNALPPTAARVSGHNPFGSLSTEGLPTVLENPPVDSVPTTKPAKRNPRRVDIPSGQGRAWRQDGYGGSKILSASVGRKKSNWPKAMRRACGTGAPVKDGQIEIQGDKRAEVARILAEANFHPVVRGG